MDSKESLLIFWIIHSERVLCSGSLTMAQLDSKDCQLKSKSSKRAYGDIDYMYVQILHLETKAISKGEVKELINRIINEFKGVSIVEVSYFEQDKRRN